jgi:hypothetical protein
MWTLGGQKAHETLPPARLPALLSRETLGAEDCNHRVREGVGRYPGVVGSF